MMDIVSSNNSSSNSSQSVSDAKPRGSKSEDKDFGSDLQSAEVTAQAATQAGAHVAQISPQAQQKALGEQMTGGEPGAKVPGKPHFAISTSADKSPADQRSAASTNAGVTISGPKPWGSEWVFEEQGGPDPHAYDGIRTLFGSPGEGAGTNLREAMTAATRSKASAGKMDPTQPATMGEGASATALTPAQNAEAAQIAREWLAHRVEQGNLPTASEMADARTLSQQMVREDAQTGGIGNGPRGEDLLAAGAVDHVMTDGATPWQAQQAVAMAAGSGYGNSGFAVQGRSSFGDPRTRASGGIPGSLNAQAPVWSRDLSGGEFLGTMDAVRGAGNSRQMQQEGGGASGGRPDLKLFAGGLSAAEGETLADRKLKGTDEFEGGQFGALGANAALGHPGSAFNGTEAMHLEGQVTQGSMAQERLSSDALYGVSGSIRNLSQQGGGEIRLKLRPENLGELHLRVVTQGNDVGLRIQASDERSKKILEDSLNHLKESLATHNLNLGKVEVSVASGAHAAFGDGGARSQDQQQPQQQQHSGAFQSPYDLGGQAGQDANRGGRQGNSPEAWDSADAINAGQLGRGRRGMASSVASHVAGVGFQVAKTGTDASGRLDVRA